MAFATARAATRNRQPMKRYLLYVALVAISSSVFFSTPVPTGKTAYANASATTASKLVQNKQPRVHKDAVTAASTQAAAPVAPVFNPNDPSTWPHCADNQFVRADNGQCADKPAVPVQPATPVTPATVATAAAVAAPAASYGGSHEDWMAAAGIAASDYTYVDYIVSHESGWRITAQNPSGAYGLCQSLPASKMASAGADWESNPVTQLSWCNSYAQSAYGGWYKAYLHWTSNQWW